MASEPGLSAASSADEAFWNRRTRMVQWRINLGWWLESLQPVLFVAAVLFVAIVLVGRRAGWNDSIYLPILAALLIVSAIVAGLRARRRFASLASARAELEAGLGLNSRLSAAAAGVGAWPPSSLWRPNLWRWSWKRIGAVPALSLILIIAAWQVPLVGIEARRVTPAVKPPALAAVEEWLEKLQQNPALDPSSLQQVQEQAEQLAEQEPAAWYSHASLEAADHLEGQLQSGLRALDQNAAVMQSLLGVGGIL